jgi:hypothetical protein
MRTPEFSTRFPRRFLALVLLGAVTAGCSSEVTSTAPEIAAAFAKPPAQSSTPATFTLPASGQSLTSDGMGNYVNGICGVVARVFYLAPDYLDGNLQLGNPRAKDRNCSLRKLTITYPNGAMETNSASMNVGDMGTVASAELRSMNIAITGSPVRCARLGFGYAIGGSQVLVTRVSATLWNVASQPGGSAACEKPDGSIELIAGFTLNFNVALN